MHFDAASSRYLNSVAKRGLDLVISLLLIAPVSIILAVAGLAVLICDGRPVILMQPRVGRGGRVFRMPKLRTMRDGQGDGRQEITRLGRFLRRHRLDELPQMFSVVFGQMTLVGPRPELVDIVAQYDESHRQRLCAKPGVTGLWQIKGSRRKRIHEALGYDMLYLRRASLCLDLKILVMTVGFMISPGTTQG